MYIGGGEHAIDIDVDIYIYVLPPPPPKIYTCPWFGDVKVGICMRDPHP